MNQHRIVKGPILVTEPPHTEGLSPKWHNFDPFILGELKGLISKSSSLFMEEAIDDFGELIHPFIDKTLLRNALNEAEDRFLKNKNLASPRNEAEINETMRAFARAVFKKDCFSTVLQDLQETHYPTYQWLMRTLLKPFKTKSNIIHSSYREKLQTIKKMFHLDSKEVQILNFYFICETFTEIKDLFDSVDFIEKMLKTKRILQKAYNISSQEFDTLLCLNGRLSKAGLLVESSLFYRELPRDMVLYLAGSDNINLHDKFLTVSDSTQVVALKDHNVKDEISNTILSILKSKGGKNILFYGRPGTGKTELAKSIGKELGKKIYFVNQKDSAGDESLKFRKIAIVAAQNIVPKGSIIVIDEADSVLNQFRLFNIDSENSDRKAWLNDFLETTSATFIWITNSISDIDDSIKRRFTYSVRFDDLSKPQRLNVWKNVVEQTETKFLNETDIELLSNHFKVNAGTITLALNTVKKIKGLNKEGRLNALKGIISQSIELHEKSVQKLETASKKYYDPKIINSDHDLAQIQTCLQQFIKEKETDKGEIKNFNILFQGPPGTGKTEYANYLSASLGQELLIKRLSDIRSPYYGQDLINIAGCFREASTQGKILFLDEADSFFSHREGNNLHYQSETNELLTQMENFKGILLCSTNFSENLDHAALRRFNFKIKFDYLTGEGKRTLFQNMLLPLCQSSMTAESWLHLDSIPCLTPGDFKVVRQKNYYLQSSTPERLLQELEIEVTYKKKLGKTVKLI